jgi:acyl-CoA synthetase (AMP-forming)/AMP-acid ligase II
MFVNWFIQSAQKFPRRPAVEVNNRQMSYKELGLLASKIAGAIPKQEAGGRPVGLLAYRSFEAYAGVLGIDMAGVAGVDDRYFGGRHRHSGNTRR